MAGFLYAFVAVLVAGFGARDQVLLARLTAAQGARATVLGAALIAAAGTSAFAGWAAQALLPQMPAAARVLFAGIALVLAGGEMVLLSPGRAPAEPTRSVFAALVVLTAQQVTDAARFLILVIGVATAAPVPATLGGAAASMAGLVLAWLAPQVAPARAVRIGRRIAGAALMALGLALGVPQIIA